MHHKISDFNELEQYINMVENKERLQINLYNENIDLLWKHFQTFFKVKVAAGGLVVNSEGDYLFIKRNGFWDLPKGHVEKGETIEAGALREVEEECGISSLILKDLRCITYHTYRLKGKLVLKYSYWYNMKYLGQDKLVPQLEEGISEACWVNPNQTKTLLQEAYSSIKEIFNT